MCIFIKFSLPICILVFVLISNLVIGLKPTMSRYENYEFASTDRNSYEIKSNRNYQNETWPSIRKLFKRSNEFMNDPFNFEENSLYVELFLVIDKKVYNKLGNDMREVHRYCIDFVNHVHGIYSSLNIFIKLIGIEVWKERNMILSSEDGAKYLDNFLDYRKEQLLEKHSNDHALLLTINKFYNGKNMSAGISTVGKICSRNQAGSLILFHDSIKNTARIAAHELAHNFGLNHDSLECNCTEENCIMAEAVTSFTPSRWSDCSIKTFQKIRNFSKNYCLHNKPRNLFDQPECGNGFLESGEECDCGLPQFCQNSCCNPVTCRLTPYAKCATGKCCNLNTCELYSVKRICRKSRSECDNIEYCDGNSEHCPTDNFKNDFVECKNGKAFCYNGLCNTRDDQCKILWGDTSESSNQCYIDEMNKLCKWNRNENRYEQCSTEDSYCGLLRCTRGDNLNSSPFSFSFDKITIESNRRSKWSCYLSNFDVAKDSIDPGMTFDGTKCGNTKMCINQKCVSIDELKKTRKINDRPQNCNGHGIRNNIGECLCDNDFIPPYCNVTSIDQNNEDDEFSSEDPNNDNVKIISIDNYELIWIGSIITVVFIVLIVCRNRAKKLPKKSEKFPQKFVFNKSDLINIEISPPIEVTPNSKPTVSS